MFKLNMRILNILAMMLLTIPATGFGKEVCPDKAEIILKHLTVFDGPAEQRAILKSEEVTENTGYWELGYVYEAGRYVTIYCDYTDNSRIEVTLKQRVSACQFSVDVKNKYTLNCQ